MNDLILPFDSSNTEQITFESEQPVPVVIPSDIQTTETIYLADPLLIEKLDILSTQQNDQSNLLIFLIGMIGGITFLKSLLKGWLDA